MITLPFPPASLSGHNKGDWWAKSPVVKEYRDLAREATEKAMPPIPADGDIAVVVTFVPPDKRGDRVNFPIRCKPLFDGIADALGVNDKRFVPQFLFADPEKPGRVEVTIASPQHAELNGFARQIALDSIKYGPTPSDVKRRILLAREWGLLDDAETEEWIGLFGVAAA